MDKRLQMLVQRRFTSILGAKRHLVAMSDSFRYRRSYSEHGEDRFIEEQLQLAGYNVHAGAYVDIGANQPTWLSNTYLFYRKGCRGVAIEPNPDMEFLFRLWRPRDTFIRVGCSDLSAVLEYKYTYTSSLNSFGNCSNDDIVKTEYLPVLTLDDIIANMNLGEIFLLSIDTEGFDAHVIRGAQKTLSKTIWVIVEQNDSQAVLANLFHDQGFRFVTRKGCNNLYFNEDNLNSAIRKQSVGAI